MRDQWTVQTGRMALTLVSEPVKISTQQAQAYREIGAPAPMQAAYLLIARPNGGDPVRIEGEDAELLMWVLQSLIGRRVRMSPHVPMGGEFGVIG